MLTVSFCDSEVSVVVRASVRPSVRQHHLLGNHRANAYESILGSSLHDPREQLFKNLIPCTTMDAMATKGNELEKPFYLKTLDTEL